MTRIKTTKEEFENRFDIGAGYGVSKPNIFNNRIFDFKVVIKPTHRDLKFNNCLFKKKVLFKKGFHTVKVQSKQNEVEDFFENSDIKTNEFDINVTFENKCVFDKELNFKNIVFSGKVRIHDCNLNKINFYNTSFNDLADFWNTEFKKPVIFHKTDFNSTAVFSMTTFKKNVLFTYSLLAGKSIFAKTEFKKGLDLSQAVISGELQLFDIHFEDEMFDTEYFKKSEKSLYRDAIDSGKTCIEYDNEKNDCIKTKKLNIPIENKVHTFQILRKAFEDVGNYNDSTKMRRVEKSTLRLLNQQLSKEKKKSDSRIWYARFCNWILSGFNVTYRDVFTNDGLILLLNRWSNNYRTNFWRGVFFTIIVASLFLTATLLFDQNTSFTLNPSKFQWKSLIIFLNPLHDIKDIIPDPNIGSYIFDYLGRIFVGYGIYQTVQAFRKFK
ncbi:MAG: hypothetical protein LAT51_07290 [Flavobacteriaceae bacterium]|nr:hypothetical protein [Flavobacteriaceae bacterium]